VTRFAPPPHPNVAIATPRITKFNFFIGAPYFAGGFATVAGFPSETYLFPFLSRLSSVRTGSSPIASIRVMLNGLNCGSYGLLVGPPDTSRIASLSYFTTVCVFGSVHDPDFASARFFGHTPSGSANVRTLYPGTAESIAIWPRAICSCTNASGYLARFACHNV